MTAAQNYLESCQTWQGYINAQDTIENKNRVAQAAFEDLKNQTFYGDRHVIVSGESALQIPMGADSEEAIWPALQYKRICTRGWLGRLRYLRMPSGDRSIYWSIYDPSVIGPAMERDLETGDNVSDLDDGFHHLALDIPLRRPLHFPVALIDYALCYGK